MSRTLAFRAILGPDGVERDRALEIGADGRIVAVRPSSGPYDGFFALPGMPNAHSHAFQRALAGFGEAAHGEDDSFWSWRQAMYRLASRLEPEGVHRIARQAFVEMLRGGFTSVLEFHYLHHRRDGTRSRETADAVLGAADEVGLPLGLFPVYYRRAGFGEEEPLPEQGRFAHRDVEEFLKLVEALGEAVAGVAPHSLRAVPAAELADLVEGAGRLLGDDAPIHIHVSEQTAEVEACRAAHGTTPIRLLADLVGLGSRWGLVHATHATPGERAEIRAAGATVILCPLTEGYLGDGLFEAREQFQQHGHGAVGSDSNARIDAIEELRVLEYGQRLRDRRRARLATRDGTAGPLWSWAARGGGRVGVRPVGALEAGASADLLVLDPEAPALAGHAPETALDAWLVGGDRGAIAAVYVGGKRRVDAGSVAGEDEIRRAFAETVRHTLGS